MKFVVWKIFCVGPKPIGGLAYYRCPIIRDCWAGNILCVLLRDKKMFEIFSELDDVNEAQITSNLDDYKTAFILCHDTRRKNDECISWCTMMNRNTHHALRTLVTFTYFEMNQSNLVPVTQTSRLLCSERNPAMISCPSIPFITIRNYTFFSEHGREKKGKITKRNFRPELLLWPWDRLCHLYSFFRSFQKNPSQRGSLCTFIEHFKEPNEVMYQSYQNPNYVIGFAKSHRKISFPIQFIDFMKHHDPMEDSFCQFRFIIGSVDENKRSWSGLMSKIWIRENIYSTK